MSTGIFPSSIFIGMNVPGGNPYEILQLDGLGKIETTQYIYNNGGGIVYDYFNGRLYGNGYYPNVSIDLSALQLNDSSQAISVDWGARNLVSPNATTVFSWDNNGVHIPGTPIINVKSYGAKGNGSTDDTTAISNAISSLPSTGGVLYFPSGVYLTSGGFTISVPTTIMGDGQSYWDPQSGSYVGYPQANTIILCNSKTADCFTVSTDVARFEKLSIRNTNPYTSPPTAGTGIKVSGGTFLQKVDMESVTVLGFYNNVIQGGASWMMNNVMCNDAVNVSLYIQNTINPDAGDWNLSNFTSNISAYAALAHVKIDSCAGGKITNLKINLGNSSAGQAASYGIMLSPAAGVNEGQLMITNSSIEGQTSYAIYGTVTATSSYGYITIDNMYCRTGSVPVMYFDAGNNPGKLFHITIANSLLIATSYTGGATKFNYVGGALLSNIDYSGSLTSSTEVQNAGGLPVYDLTAFVSPAPRTFNGMVLGGGGIGGYPLIYNSSISAPTTNYGFTQGTAGDTYLNGSTTTIRTAATNAVYIGSTQKIGIGNTSPGGRFDITGTTDDIQLRVKGNSTQTNDVFDILNSSSGKLFGIDNSGNHLFFDGGNVVLGSTTGTKFGTATTQKLSFYNSTPIVQPSGSITTALTNLGLISSPSIAIGTAISSGGAKRVLYEDASQNLAASANLSYDGTTLISTGYINILSATSGANTYSTRQNIIQFNRNDIPTTYNSYISASWSGADSSNTISFELPNGAGTTTPALTIRGDKTIKIVGVGGTGASGGSGIVLSTANNDLLISSEDGSASSKFRLLPFGSDCYFDNTANGDWYFRTNEAVSASTILHLYANGNALLTGKMSSYNGDTTDGNGIVSVVKHVGLTAQTASITATSLFTPASNGTYRVNIYMVDTTTGGAGTATTTITWTDDSQSQSFTTTAINLSVLGAYQSNTLYIQAKTTAAIKYSTTLSGVVGSPQYSLYIDVERLS